MITQTEQTKISELLSSMTLCSGVGTKESACSIAAINLALSGRLTDDIPECMSEVIGNWIIRIQDSMPDSVRNSREWKSLLPQAAGTGRSHETQRSKIILEWMWCKVLPQLQSTANTQGFGESWQTMCTEKTADAAYSAADAADAAAYSAADAAAYAADAAAYAADAAAYAADAVARADAAYAVYAVYAVARAADAVARAAAADFWLQVNPVHLLEQLVKVSYVQNHQTNHKHTTNQGRLLQNLRHTHTGRLYVLGAHSQSRRAGLGSRQHYSCQDQARHWSQSRALRLSTGLNYAPTTH